MSRKGHRHSGSGELSRGRFHEDDADLLSQIGSQVAIAVENALNFEQTRLAQRQVAQERDRSKLLLEVNNAVISHLNLTDLLKSFTASLRGVMQHDSAFINLCADGGTQMRQTAWMWETSKTSSLRKDF